MTETCPAFECDNHREIEEEEDDDDDERKEDRNV